MIQRPSGDNIVTDKADESSLQAELERLMDERDKVHADLHNTGDQKHARRLESLNAEILTLQTALGDGRV